MKRIPAAALALGLLSGDGLHAQQAATLRVGAQVEESCGVTIPSRGVLRATCTPRATYFLSMNNAQQRSALQAPALTGVGTGAPVDHSLFGGVPASQIVPPADAADLVLVRVFY